MSDAGGVQGTDGDLSMDTPQAHPKNEDAVIAAPPELPAQDLKQYKQAVMSLLRPGETIPAALRCGFVSCTAFQYLGQVVVLISGGWVGIAMKGSNGFIQDTMNAPGRS